MNPDPLVSVILTVFNNEKYIAEAIKSVLDQSYRKIELICVNDGSTDNTLKILQSFGDKIILISKEVNSGIASGRNTGVKAAKGEFLALMDGDDIWLPEKLEMQINLFKEKSDIDIVFCLMKCFLSPDLPEEEKALRHCPTEAIAGHVSAASVIKKSSFDKVGYFDTSLRVGEFIDWCAKAKEMGFKVDMVNKLLYMRRIHSTNTGVTERPARVDYLKILKSSLDRKRNAK